MRLAFCLFRYFPHGGLQRDFLEIAQLCQKAGHDIHVYTMRWTGEKPTGITVHIVKSRGWANHTRAINFSIFLKKLLSYQVPDCVIGFNKIPGLDIYFAADDCYIANNIAAWKRLTPRFRAYAKLEKAVFSKEAKTKILVLTQKQQQEIMQYYQTPTERFALLPPDINLSRNDIRLHTEHRETFRKKYHLKKTDIMLLMVCSYFHTKGVDRSLRALASLPAFLREKTRLFVVGGDNNRTYQSLSKKLGVENQVYFMGARRNIISYYHAADLLLHPARLEAAGKVLLEALSQNLPVLTTDNCGYSAYITDAQAGKVLSSPFSQKNYNAALAEILQDKYYFRLRQNAADYMAKQHWPAVNKTVFELIERIALEKAGCA